MLAPPQSTTASASQPRGPNDGVQWTYGQVPALGPGAQGSDRCTAQLAYACTLLAVVMEAAVQLETVVENLEQINREQGDVDGAAQDVAPESKTPERKDHCAEAAN